MSIFNPSAVVMTAPEYQLDQIVDLMTGSITVGAATTNAFNVVTLATAKDIKATLGGKIYLFKGIFSADNGASWNEFGNAIPLSGTDANGTRQLTATGSIYNQTAAADIDSVTDSVLEVDVSNGGASGFTILYKVLILARPDQGKIPTPNQLPALLNYSNQQNYMKVFKDFIQSLPTSSTTPFNHALGYVPNTNSWILTTDNPFDGFFIISNVSGYSVDSQNVTFSQVSTTGNPRKVYCRVYLDK